jgi:hypothetical protein
MHSHDLGCLRACLEGGRPFFSASPVLRRTAEDSAPSWSTKVGLAWKRIREQYSLSKYGTRSEILNGVQNQFHECA